MIFYRKMIAAHADNYYLETCRRVQLYGMEFHDSLVLFLIFAKFRDMTLYRNFFRVNVDTGSYFTIISCNISFLSPRRIQNPDKHLKIFAKTLVNGWSIFAESSVFEVCQASELVCVSMYSLILIGTQVFVFNKYPVWLQEASTRYVL